MYIGWTGEGAGAVDTCTLNVGASGFVGTAPVGYSPWDATGATTFDPANKGAAITLSGGNLSASRSNTNAWQTVWSTTFHYTGKFYFELACGTLSNTSNGQAIGVGGCRFTGDLIGYNMGSSFGSLCGGFELFWPQNVPSGTVAWGAGQTVCCAVDLDNNLIWFRNGASGNWNGSALANPATGVGGITILRATQMVNPYMAFATAPTAGDLLVVNGQEFGGLTTLDDKWTLDASTGSVFSAYRYAQAGEPKAQCLDPGSKQTVEWNMCAWDLSGASGVWATDHVLTTLSGTNLGPSSTPVGASLTTQAGTSLVLAAFTGETTTSRTLSGWSTGWTNDGYFISTQSDISASAFDFAAPGHIGVTGGATVQPTLTFSGSVTSVRCGYMEFAAGTSPGNASGPIGNIVLGGVAGNASVAAGASGPIGNVILGGITGHATGTGAASGPIGNIVLGGVTGTAGVVPNSHTTQMFLPILAKDTSIAHATQGSLLALGKNSVTGRASQAYLDALGKNAVNGRLLQMALLVLARGIEPPIKPDPLSLSDQGRRMVVRQRFVNMYSEPTPQGPSDSARYQRGGLYNLTTKSAGPIRGLLNLSGFLVTVSGDSVWLDNDNIGNVDPSGICTMDRSEDELVIVSGNTAYTISSPLFGDATVTQNTSSAFPPEGVIDVAFDIERFIYIDNNNTGIFRWSEAGDSLNVGPINFATVEGSPVKLLAVWVLNDEVAFFTAETVEWWYPSGDSTAPWYPSTGRKYNRGLAAIRSIELQDNSLIWLGDDRIVYRTGAIPIRISNFDVEDRLRKCLDVDLPNCSGHGAEFGGHKFYVLDIPKQGTWAYDFAEKNWAEWKSFGKDQYRVNVSDDTFRIYGDKFSGQVFGLDGGLFTDLGDPIERIVSTYMPIRSGIVNNFNLCLYAMRGVGLTPGQYGDQPVVEMRYTDHEDADWSPWMTAPLGEQGDKGNESKAIWEMLGGMQAPGRLFEFRCTDPVRFSPYAVRANEERL